MTIEEKRASLEATINCLIWDVSSSIEELDEKFTELSNLAHPERYVDIDKLIQAMKKDKLYTPEMENFLEEYLKFYNN